jgi:non-ribosomal peptide synthase protein (TIGR01720 family)
VSLSEHQTSQLLIQSQRIANINPEHILLTGLYRAVNEWLDDRKSSTGRGLLIQLERHGRDSEKVQADITRTVGWCAISYPKLLRITPGLADDAGLRQVKEQLLGSPNDGLSYGLLRYICADPNIRSHFGSARNPEIAFNYFGQLDNSFASDLFKQANAPSGDLRGRSQARPHLLEINCMVADGKLKSHWYFSTKAYRRESIEAAANRFIDRVEKLVEACSSIDSNGYTPSDFALREISQSDLDDALREVGL